MSDTPSSPSADLLLEQELLGCLICTPEALAAVASSLQPEHFAQPLHGRLFEALKARHAAGAPSSPVTLAAALKMDWSAPVADDLTVGQYVARLGVASGEVVHRP